MGVGGTSSAFVPACLWIYAPQNHSYCWLFGIELSGFE